MCETCAQKVSDTDNCFKTTHEALIIISVGGIQYFRDSNDHASHCVIKAFSHLLCLVGTVFGQFEKPFDADTYEDRKLIKNVDQHIKIIKISESKRRKNSEFVSLTLCGVKKLLL